MGESGHKHRSLYLGVTSASEPIITVVPRVHELPWRSTGTSCAFAAPYIAQLDLQLQIEFAQLFAGYCDVRNTTTLSAAFSPIFACKCLGIFLRELTLCRIPRQHYIIVVVTWEFHKPHDATNALDNILDFIHKTSRVVCVPVIRII